MNFLLLQQIQVEGDAEGTMIYCALVQATAHEKQVFSNAIREMLSPIENPRYLFIKEMGLFGGKFAHRYSYSCPSVLGRRKEDAAILDDYLKRCSGGFLLVYTRSEKGRKELLRCRRYSYLKQNSRFIGDKKVLDSKWD